MKVHPQKVKLGLALIGIMLGVLIFSCKKNDTNNTGQSRVQIKLTDSPESNVSGVWVDVKDVLINMGDSNWKSVIGAHAGVYNLLDFTDGKDTLLADAEIPAGTISQIRLLLGDNNYIVTK